MRQLVGRLAASGLLLAAFAERAPAQQGSVQITAAAHNVAGDPVRTAGQPSFEPDLGVTWLQPGTRIGLFQMEVRGTQRDGRVRLGKAFVGIRDWKHRGITWSFELGDTWFSPSIADYRLTNLSSPTSTFAGGSVRARTAKASASLVAGRATAWRNIFGSDAEVLDQSVLLTRGSYAFTDRLEVSARVSRIRTTDLGDLTFTIAESDQGGGGVRYVVTPAVHLVGDATLVGYRRRGLEEREVDASAVAGVNILLARGWIQANVSRFSPGEMPVPTQPLADRQTLFAAGEYDVFRRIRLHGGWEVYRSNLDPEGAVQSGSFIPSSEGTRGFAGIRVPIGQRSSGGLRYEDGDRRARYVGASLTRISDTGVLNTEWQTTLGPLSAFLRYARRENVETENVAGTYTQHDSLGHAFVNVTRTVQIFGSATAIRNTHAAGDGSNLWQFGGGGQAQLMRRGLWLRAEGLKSRNVDILGDRTVPHERYTLGLNGEIARNTIIGVNLYADRYTSSVRTTEPWTLRSTLRLSRNFLTGSTRSSSSIAGGMSRHGGTGSIVGSVFADWNNNGIQESGDDPLENIPIRLANLGSASTAGSGDFAFIDVPIGLQQVGIDLGSLPVDFDPPPVAQVQVDLSRGETKRLTFGLLPLGVISGRVILDTNVNGRADAGEPSVESAVLILDNGVRSEAVRRGGFRFDAVRTGEHTVELLSDSLPDGSVVIGPSVARLAIGRGALSGQTDFLVERRTRPEIRRVFPGSGRERPPASTAPPGRGGGVTPEAANREAPRSREGVSREPTSRTEPAPSTGTQFAVQVAALSDPLRARLLVEQLRRKGFASYLVEPSGSDPHAPFRIRVGPYATRPAAMAAAHVLQNAVGGRTWVIRER